MPLRAPQPQDANAAGFGRPYLPHSAPTEVDHYQIRRTVDVYVAPTGEDLSKVYAGVQKIIGHTQAAGKHDGSTCAVRCRPCAVSFKSFGLGLILSTLLVYLILVAQFKSFLDPFLILLAVPTGADRRAADPVCSPAPR